MLSATSARIAVLHFTNAPVRGGAEEHMLTLLHGLDRARYRPLLAARPAQLDLLRADLPADVVSFPVALRSPHDLARARHLIRILREQRVALVHAHMFQASRQIAPLAWAAGIRAIVETPHLREHWRTGWLKGNFALDRLAGRLVSKFIAVSHANAAYLLQTKRLPYDKVVVVRNGIALERFDPLRPAPAALRAQLGLAHSARVILVMARLEPQKGHRVLLDAWPAVLAAFPCARLVCIGEGTLRDELKAMAERRNLGASVTFAGYQTNVADWLALAEFTVLPSWFEGLPLAALESLAAGRPVIASEVDGTGEAVVAETTGLLVPPGDVDALAIAMRRLLGAPELAQRLGRRGRHLVEREFSASRQIAATEAVYEAALARGPAGGGAPRWSRMMPGPLRQIAHQLRAQGNGN